MRPVSAAFLRTLTGSHRVFARARVCTTFQTGVAPTGTEIGIVDGSVRLDSSADVRSSVDMVTSGYRSWPHRPEDLLAPYGNELFVERGINYGNGTIEIVSLGYHRIDSTRQETGPDGEIQLTASDRMAGIVDARLPFPVQFPIGTSVETAFTRLVNEVYPLATIEYDFAANASLFDTAHVAEEDRYAFLRDVAQSRGKIIYWDYRGILRVVSPPDPTVPVYEINSGYLGELTKLSRTLSRQGVYNGVVATGEATGTDTPPVTSLVFDANPNSPTYWNGKFGRVPRFYYSSFITTTDAATSAAQSILQQATGLPYSIDLDAVPNPALEPYDPIQITSPDSVDIHVVDTLNVPLTSSGTMSGTTRKLLSFNTGDPI